MGSIKAANAARPQGLAFGGWRVLRTFSTGGVMAQDLPPIIVILRGITPDEIMPVADALFEVGIRGLEVPLDSPDAYVSLTRLCKAYGDKALCGGGTVLEEEQVELVKAAGARMITSPESNPAVIRKATSLGLLPIAGFMTPTEALASLRAGAGALKLYPAGGLGPLHLRSVREVLPKDFPVYAAGGIDASNLGQWARAGATGIAAGGSVYRPGRPPDQVADRAWQHMLAWSVAFAPPTPPQQQQPEKKGGIMGKFPLLNMGSKG
jgi:2-dehydro-3-deoxyphosphogalactonate aldolase